MELAQDVAQWLVTYEGVYKSSRTESITKYTLKICIKLCCPYQSIPLPSYAMGPAFLPLLESTLEMTSWNRL